MKTENDQWLSNGKCSICRRKPYCSKKCKPRKEWEHRFLAESFKENFKNLFEKN